MSGQFTSEWLADREKKRSAQMAKNLSNIPLPTVQTVEHPVTETTFMLGASTDESKLNKTEASFLAYLRHSSACWVGVQNITLKLADDCRYTPDFACISDAKFTFYEVKGFWRDDAKVKIKVAARLFPMFKFVVVMKDKGGWKFEDVKP